MRPRIGMQPLPPWSDPLSSLLFLLKRDDILHRMVRDCLHNGSNPTNRNLAEEDSDLCFSFTLVSFPPRFI